MADPQVPIPARDVVLAALAAPLPGGGPDGNAWVTDRADLIVAALIQHGHLPDPEHRPTTEADYEEAARWLAGQSHHARYRGEGYVRILQAEADVDVAYTAAERRCAPADQNTLSRVRAMLLAYTGPRRITR